MAESLSMFAACSPGLEPWLEQELRELGLQPGPEPGGFSFSGSVADGVIANVRLRTALFVSWVLGTFRARQFPELVRKAKALPWRQVLVPGTRVDLRVTTKRSRLYHCDAVAERFVQAIQATVPQVCRAARSDDDAIRVRVRLEFDRCTVAVDTSGWPLTARGYRLQTGKAPLRADIAWVMLELADLHDRPFVVDPMCGAGTIPIEAALRASGRRVHRSFAFERFPSWRDVPIPPVEQSLETSTTIIGADRDAGAVEASLANAERAGVADRTTFRRASLSETLDPKRLPRSGLVITNPPYGRRVSSQDLSPLYRSLGQRIAALGPGWTTVLACPDPDRVRLLDLELEHRAWVDHGGIRVGLYRSRPTRS